MRNPNFHSLNSLVYLGLEFTLSLWISKPKCSIMLDSFFPGSLLTTNDPNTQVGYYSGPISRLKLLLTDFAVPTLKLLPSELVKVRNYNLSYGLRLPLIERIKQAPLQINFYYLYWLSFWSLSFLMWSAPCLFPV